MKNYICIAVIFFLSTSLKAQIKTSHIDEIKRFNHIYEQGKLDERSYLRNVDSLLFSFLEDYNGQLPTSTLKDLLANYKKIAWSSKKNDYNKSVYYGHLASNADLANRGSEAIFYAEKYDQILHQNNRQGFLQQAMAFTHYHNSNNFPKITEKYEENQSNFYNLFFNKKLSISARINLAKYSALAVEAYLETNQIEKAATVLHKLRKINEILQKDKDLNANDKTASDINLLEQEVKFSLAKNKPDLAKTFINQIESGLSQKAVLDSLHLKDFEDQISRLKISYLTRTGHYSEAQSILNNIVEKKYADNRSSLLDIKEKAYLLSRTKGYEEAYATLYNGMKLYEKKYLDLTNEMDDLLYAHTQAEYDRAELDQITRSKKVQLVWMLGIGFSLITLLAISIALRIRERKKTAGIINGLNDITEIMINKAKEEASIDEKRKLGQDLHDDLSGSLASLLHVIKQAETETNPTATPDNLAHIFNRTDSIYKTVRNKSHLMYELTNNSSDNFLDETIRKIANTALPDKEFMKEIEIDSSVSDALPADTKIEIIRIVQEAINNIVKHAKKASDVFIFLYREQNTAILQISDNGKAKKKSLHTKKGLGFQSITNRVENLKGKFDISTEEGMKLTISFPIEY